MPVSLTDVVWFAGAIAGIFAVVNPLQVLTPFRYMTKGFDDATRNGLIRNAVLAGGGFLVTFVVVGDLLFRLYRISVPAFRIAGGILVLHVAFKMLWGQPVHHADPERADPERRESLGISPIGIPLLAGPAAIGTVMLYASRAVDLVDTAVVVAAIVVVFLIVYGLLKGVDRVFATVGEAGLAVSSALMGLLLAAVAVQFILDGIQLALVEWGLLAPQP